MAFTANIAGFTVRFDDRFGRLARRCAAYTVPDGPAPDYEIRVTDADLAAERAKADDPRYSDGYIESLAAYRKLCSAIPLCGAFLLHGSVIDCAGRGIAFLAPSGVGKTTHTMLWAGEYPSEVTVINGDKPIIRVIDGIPYAYGTPWAGKENLQTNARVRLTDLCFIRRGAVNSCAPVSVADASFPLIEQVYIPEDAEAAGAALSLADGLLKNCGLWLLTCNTDPAAAHTAHAAIFGGKGK